MLPKISKWLLILLLQLAFGYSLASAESVVKVALSAKPTTLDPHIWLSQPNWAVHLNTFQNLAIVGENDNEHSIDALQSPNSYLYRQGLVDSVTQVSDNQLIINLVKDVKFHDGTDLTTTDVVFSINRIKKIGKDSSFLNNVIDIKKMTILGPYQLEISTDIGTQTLIAKLRQVLIIKANDQDEIIGSGLYRITSGDNLEHIKLVLAQQHLDQHYISDAELIYVPDISKRLELLLNNEVQLIEQITPTEVEKLAPDRFNLTYVDTNRLIYLAVDLSRDNSPFIFDAAGKNQLRNNPLKERSVREAISLAVDKNHLVNSVLNGAAIKTNQYMRSTSEHYLSQLEETEYNPTLAKKLLEESGYPPCVST